MRRKLFHENIRALPVEELREIFTTKRVCEKCCKELDAIQFFCKNYMRLVRRCEICSVKHGRDPVSNLTKAEKAYMKAIWIANEQEEFHRIPKFNLRVLQPGESLPETELYLGRKGYGYLFAT